MSHKLPPSKTLHSHENKHPAEQSDNLIQPKVSPSTLGSSPFRQGPKKPHNIFFNASISISQLKVMGDIDIIDEEADDSPENVISWEQNKIRIDNLKSKNSSISPVDSLIIKKIEEKQPLEKASPLQVSHKVSEIKKKFVWAEVSYDSDFTPTPVNEIKPKEKANHIEIKQEPVILQAPPLKPAVLKRKKRGEFQDETIIQNRYTGILKFYKLKNRFGFIAMDDGSTDVFICEDDLVLSGVNLKKFKQDVYNKIPIQLSFLIKEYEDKGKPKRKAVEISMTENKIPE
ncbi:unnamed protein product [Blepharisma stoltei]|uniref:CSD domain-containing protein n=1 Tax=Blepharisma stoltei TaxID=1481888 RepID=A0AAU9J129_9CILI|nr:unnamed protein product [Blepharisma stoltei]